MGAVRLRVAGWPRSLVVSGASGVAGEELGFGEREGEGIMNAGAHRSASADEIAKRTARILALVKQGVTPPVIAKRLGVSADSVRAVLRANRPVSSASSS
jgi:DNA-binding CsgD family transcriptional regulator